MLHAYANTSLVERPGADTDLGTKSSLGTNIIRVMMSAIFLGMTFIGSGLPGLAQESQFEQFSTHDPASTRRINYQQLDEFIGAISENSRGRTKFRYDILNREGKSYLNQYAGFFARQDPTSFNQDEQLAYWLNLHNLLVVKTIASEGATKRLKSARGTFHDSGPVWTKKIITVNGTALSINDIERNIILANWTDSEIYYGLYQGSRGGIAFPEKSFSGATVKEQLLAAAQTNINAPGSVKVKKDQLILAAPYGWYRDALFEGNDDKLISHITMHANKKLKGKMAKAKSVTFAKMNYKADALIVRAQQNYSGSIGGGGGGAPTSGS